MKMLFPSSQQCVLYRVLVFSAINQLPNRGFAFGGDREIWGKGDRLLGTKTCKEAILLGPCLHAPLVQ